MKSYILLVFLFWYGNLFSQSPNFVKYNGQDEALEIINKAKLDSLLKHSSAQLNLVLLYTNGCSGTPYALRRIDRYRKTYGQKMNFILCSSEPYKEIKNLKKLLAKFEIQLPKTYIIDSELYPDDKRDAREKSVSFRDDICEKCRPDIIGVPYHLLFDERQKILFSGYTAMVNFDSLVNSYIQK